MPKRKLVSLLSVLFLGVALTLVGCGEKGTAPNSTQSDEAVVTTSFDLTIESLTERTVQSGDTDSIATINAILRTSSGEAASGETVVFRTTGGKLSALSVDSDDNGVASVDFSAGPEKSNGEFTVTASVGSQSATVKLRVEGSSVALDVSGTNIVSGDQQGESLIVTVNDSEDSPIDGALVEVTADPVGSLTLTPSSSDHLTNSQGQITYTLVAPAGGTNGSTTLTVSSKGEAVKQAFTVGAAQTVFGIVSPVAAVFSNSTSGYVTIRVNVPDADGVVIFSTSHGEFDSIGSGNIYKEVTAVDSIASVDLYAGIAGTATVDVSDAADSEVRDSLKVQFYAPASEASQIIVQASKTAIPIPMVGDPAQSSEITATVRTSTDTHSQAVGQANVQFTIVNPTSGGESLSRGLVRTDALGRAVTSFVAGNAASSSLDGGIEVKASVVDTSPAIEDSINIIIAGEPASVVVNSGTRISSDPTGTLYILPMVVQVSDIGGAAIEGAKVTMGLWPSRYRTGIWAQDAEDEDKWKVFGVWHDNEDTNRNAILDDEIRDDDGNVILDTHGNVVDEDQNGDEMLTPQSASAGSLPRSVVTDSRGAATFDMVYLKAYSRWIEAEVTASVEVQGSETKSTITFELPSLEGDEEHLNVDSPFNFTRPVEDVGD